MKNTFISQLILWGLFLPFVAWLGYNSSNIVHTMIALFVGVCIGCTISYFVSKKQEEKELKKLEEIYKRNYEMFALDNEHGVMKDFTEKQIEIHRLMNKLKED